MSWRQPETSLCLNKRQRHRFMNRAQVVTQNCTVHLFPQSKTGMQKDIAFHHMSCTNSIYIIKHPEVQLSFCNEINRSQAERNWGVITTRNFNISAPYTEKADF